MCQVTFLVSMSDSEPMPPQVPDLRATYFDGKSAHGQAALVRIQDESLQLSLVDGALTVPISQIDWSERTRYGRRSAQLPGNAILQCDDSTAWDAWRNAHGLADAPLIAIQQSWSWVAGFTAALVLFIFAAYQWGLPILAKTVLIVTPYSVDQKIGQIALEQLDGPSRFLQPSGLSAVEQDAIRRSFQQALSLQESSEVPPWHLEFRKSALGPNAFALPGGTMVMTDEMLDLVEGDHRTLVAVLSHELGHVHHRHGMRMLVQASAIGVVASALWGDVSWILATLPAWLGQADYSRQAEREADAYALQVLVAARIHPNAMVNLFDKLKAKREALANSDGAASDKDRVGQLLGIAFSSHPQDAERIAFFQAAAPR